MTRKWLILIFIFCCISGKITAHDNSLKLWYDKPAKQWVEALPLGNGRIGAMVFGDPAHERSNSMKKLFGAALLITILIPTLKKRCPAYAG